MSHLHLRNLHGIHVCNFRQHPANGCDFLITRGTLEQVEPYQLNNERNTSNIYTERMVYRINEYKSNRNMSTIIYNNLGFNTDRGFRCKQKHRVQSLIMYKYDIQRKIKYIPVKLRLKMSDQHNQSKIVGWCTIITKSELMSKGRQSVLSVST
jgi:hypothetical protein